MKRSSIIPKAIKKAVLGLMVLITITGQGGAIAVADSTNPNCPKGMSTLDCNALLGDWMAWIPDVCNQGQGSNSASLSGDSRLQQIFNYLITNGGFTKEQAAGITGNIKVESRGDPKIYQADGKDYDIPPGDAGWGIVQWTPPIPKIVTWAESQGQQPSDLTTQLNYLIAQLNGTTNISSEQKAGDQLKAVTTGIVVNGVQQSTAWHAAQVFLQTYERAKDSAPDGPNANTRGSWADQILAAWGASAPTGQSGSSTTDSAASGCPSSAGGATAGAGFLGDPGAAAVLAANPGGNGDPPVAQCVGYVKYELDKHFPPYHKAGDPALGNGIDVAANLGKDFGVTVNTTPAVHSVFSMPVGLFGHTGIVSAVALNNDGSLKSITVEEYNWVPGAYDMRTLDAAYITQHGMTFAHTEVKWQ